MRALRLVEHRRPILAQRLDAKLGYREPEHLLDRHAASRQMRVTQTEPTHLGALPEMGMRPRNRTTPLGMPLIRQHFLLALIVEPVDIACGRALPRSPIARVLDNPVLVRKGQRQPPFALQANRLSSPECDCVRPIRHVVAAAHLKHFVRHARQREPQGP
jgi:hypothetical protein